MKVPRLTRKRVAAAAAVPCLLACALAAFARAPQPDEEVLNALKRAKAAEAATRQAWSLRDLPHGTADRLKGLTAADVARMEIFALKGDAERPAKRYAEGPLDGEGQVAAVLALFKAAAHERPRDLPPGVMTHTLVVEPVAGKGEPFEIPYDADRDAPIGGVESRALKEALWGLSHALRCSLVHLKDGRVVDSWVERMPPIGRMTAGGGLALRTELDAQGRVILHVKIGPADAPGVDGAQSVRYGQAVAFAHREGGHVVALLDFQ